MAGAQSARSLQINYIFKVVEQEKRQQIFFQMPGDEEILPYVLPTVFAQPFSIVRVGEKQTKDSATGQLRHNRNTYG